MTHRLIIYAIVSLCYKIFSCMFFVHSTGKARPTEINSNVLLCLPYVWNAVMVATLSTSMQKMCLISYYIL